MTNAHIVCIALGFKAGLRAQLGSNPTDAPTQMRGAQVTAIREIVASQFEIDMPDTLVRNLLDTNNAWVCDFEGNLT